MQRFIDWKFWLDFGPEALSVQSTLVLLVLFLGLIIGALGYFFTCRKSWGTMVKPQKESVRMIRTWLITAGVLGLVWLFFAYEGIRILSSKFWLIVAVLLFGVWAYNISRFTFVEVPKRLAQIEKSRQFSKYLPKKK